jgi:RNA polymerase sigma-70 factor (ECF subfamily)
MQAPDPILILRAQSGDRDALDALLRHCQSPLHRYLIGLLGDAAAADDVLQETLFRIARKLRWLSQPALFRAWAFRIASREARRHLGRQRPFEPLDETALESDPPPSFAFDAGTLRSAVSVLSPGSRAVIALHYWEELPLADIAAILDLPLGTVKSRLAYGLKQLRRIHDQG